MVSRGIGDLGLESSFVVQTRLKKLKNGERTKKNPRICKTVVWYKPNFTSLTTTTTPPTVKMTHQSLRFRNGQDHDVVRLVFGCEALTDWGAFQCGVEGRASATARAGHSIFTSRRRQLHRTSERSCFAGPQLGSPRGSAQP